MLFSVTYKIDGGYATAYFDDDSFEGATGSVNKLRDVAKHTQTVVKTTKTRSVNNVLQYMYEVTLQAHKVTRMFRIFSSSEGALSGHIDSLLKTAHALQRALYCDL